MTRSKMISALALAVVVVVVLITAGAAGSDLFAAEKAEADAVYEGLIGAESAGLAMGAYESETGTTAGLSEEALQQQIDAYNAQIDRYYAMDNPCRELYKNWNESYLRDTYVDKVSYRLEGGILDYNVERLTFDDDGNTATVKLTYISYNKWVDSTESGTFEIVCCASESYAVAEMVKEDGVWKLLRYVEDVKLDDWIPQDALGGGIQTYSMTEDAPEVVEAANIADAEYTSFSEAINAANQISVEEICPLTAE